MNQPTKPSKPSNEFRTFVRALSEEVGAMSDAEVLEGVDLEQLRARRARIVEAAKKEAGRRRLAAGRAMLQSSGLQGQSVGNVDPDEARRYIARAANDKRYTLAARQLGEGLSDDEAIRLYHQLRALEQANGREAGDNRDA